MSARAPRDGTVIALTSRELAVAPLVDRGPVKFDPTKLSWLANLNAEIPVLFVKRELGIRTLDELKTKEIKVGAAGATATHAVYSYALNNLLGTKLQVVTGYPGTNDLLLAVERGEIDGVGGLAWSSLRLQRPDWIKDGRIVPILQLGANRTPELKDVPLLIDLVRNDDERQAVELIFGAELISRPFFAPPETPAHVVGLLRKAFADLNDDAEFKAIADRARLDITFMDGETLQKTVLRLNAAKADAMELARRAIKR